MPKYKVPVTFSFQGSFLIEARSKEEAELFAEKHCGMVAGQRGVHSSLPEEDVDWDFPVHPVKKVGMAELK